LRTTILPRQANPITPRNLYRYNYTGYQNRRSGNYSGTGFNKNHDKLFFFWNQEFYSQLVPVQGLTTFYTPTPLERAGDFSQSKDFNGNPIIVYNPFDRPAVSRQQDRSDAAQPDTTGGICASSKNPESLS